MGITHRTATLVAALGGLLAFTTTVSAVPINYGNFAGNTVTYVGVTEDSGTDPTPLFGAPNVSADTLDFNPTSFNSTSTGANGVDITDGTLSFMIQANQGFAIPLINFSEAGDFTLAGLGGQGTFASVTANFVIEINEVDGSAINPVQFQAAMTFNPSNGDWDLLNDGPGPAVGGAWTGSLLADIQAALVSNSVPFTLGATKVTVTLDNTLTTLSEAGTQSFIAKKDAGGVTITVFPEPASLALLGLGVAGIISRQR